MFDLPDGSAAPALLLPTADGGSFDLSAQGLPTVVFFYPKADTPACTDEARHFSALLPEFAKAGVAVVGVSPDAVKKLARFVAKHDLTVPLASDETTEAAQAWGVWGEKTLYGRTYMGVERATFLVDRDGRIARSWRKVKVKDHAADVLAAARAL
ncbi:MAG TPA: peroxiredoxin [Brevundimonas sp.]|jgi:peroxiredoxin Q/BCP|uniref:peroxiredoxin n=1 Tax=Brevundimonas sp. TaxID=1871086 RepID=UPI002DE25C7B|nr:peroxiredoxin [Brevundimonas sp.]